ncbi:uncharacterized protein LOC143692336 [Agelaius phoeniceus]|uniref:uncharacterized protein LOC143692336 n=1 Tax=Agelaius phoeniceus TaxID=39638 RepID=UPI004054CA3B
MDTPTRLGGNSSQIRRWAGSVVATPPALSHSRRGPGGAKPWRVFGAFRTRSCWRSSRAGAGPWMIPTATEPPQNLGGGRERGNLLWSAPQPLPHPDGSRGQPPAFGAPAAAPSPPGTPQNLRGPPEPPPGSGRLLPLRAQLVALGVIGGALLGLLLLGGAPG